MKLVQEAITKIRNIRRERNVPPKTELIFYIQYINDSIYTLFDNYKNYFLKLARVKLVEYDNTLNDWAKVSDFVQNVKFHLVFTHYTDEMVKQQRTKLEKQLAKLEKELKIINGKLNNTKFIYNAPEQIVSKEKEKFEEVKTKLDKTKEILKGLK